MNNGQRVGGQMEGRSGQLSGGAHDCTWGDQADKWVPIIAVRPGDALEAFLQQKQREGLCDALWDAVASALRVHWLGARIEGLVAQCVGGPRSFRY